MQKIVPFLWFNDQAEAAVAFYTGLFNDSRTKTPERYGKEGADIAGQPVGSVMTIEFEIAGYRLIALNGGPAYDFTPAISFTVNCENRSELENLWENLSAGGKILMPLDKYSFSERYGWLQDKFGVSWQLNLATWRQKIVPSLMFTGLNFSKAEEAMRKYQKIFSDSAIEKISRFESDQAESSTAVRHAVLRLANQDFFVSDSSLEHGFNFSPAISLMVNCADQTEVDKLWQQLSVEGETEQCGWLKDKYGVSWQVVPTELNDLLQGEDQEKARQVMAAMLKMKKIDIAALRDAYKE